MMQNEGIRRQPDGVWVKNGSRGLAGRQGPPEGVSSCGDRATARYEDICNRAISALFHAS